MFRMVYSVLLLLFATVANAGYEIKYDNGVELDFGGRLVLQYKDYELTDREDDAFALVEGDGDILAQDDALSLTHGDQEFVLRRIRPSINAKFNDDWEARLSWEFGDGPNNIKNAYVRYRGIDWLDIKVGHETVPFGRERMTSSGRQHAPERALTGDTEFGVPGRMPGIHFTTRFDIPVNMQLSYVDANVHGDLLTEIQFRSPWGATEVEDNLQDKGTMTVARIDYNIFGKVRYREGHLKGKPGLNLSMALMDWDHKNNINVVEIDHVEGWEVALAYRGYDLSVDLQYHDISATSPYTIERRLFDNGKAHLQTFSAELGYLFFEKQLELFGSYQTMAADEWDKNWRVYELGASYLIDKHNHKVQLSYQRETFRKGRDADKNTLYLQWQYNY